MLLELAKYSIPVLLAVAGWLITHLLELAKYSIPVLLGVAGWLITHLLANWRQNRADLSEHRWKLVNTYADYINACSKCADRIYQLKSTRNFWAGKTKTKEYDEEVDEMENNYYLASSAVDSSWTLLELLEPYKPYGEGLRVALAAYERMNGSEEKAKLKEFFKFRKELVQTVHKELVVTWQPAGLREISDSWRRRQKSKLKQQWEHFKGRFKRTKPVTKEDSA